MDRRPSLLKSNYCKDRMQLVGLWVDQDLVRDSCSWNDGNSLGNTGLSTMPNFCIFSWFIDFPEQCGVYG